MQIRKKDLMNAPIARNDFLEGQNSLAGEGAAPGPSTNPTPPLSSILEPSPSVKQQFPPDRRPSQHGSTISDFYSGPSPLPSASSIQGDLRHLNLPSISSAYDPVRQSYTQQSPAPSYAQQSPAPAGPPSFPRPSLGAQHQHSTTPLYTHSTPSHHLNTNVDPTLQQPAMNPHSLHDNSMPGTMSNQMPSTMSNTFLSDSLDTPFDFRGFNGNPNDMLTYWLSQADNDIDFPMIPFPDVGVPFEQTPQPTTIQEPESRLRSDSGSVSSIPDSRFARVEEVWRDKFAKASHFQTIWSDVASSSHANIFCSDRAVSGPSFHDVDSRWGLNNAIRGRLRAEFETPAGTPAASKTASAQRLRSAFPPTEVLDISLDIYFRRIHPIVPFIHVPTFKAASTSPSLLFTMCILGISTMSQSVGGKFLKKAFLAVRLRALQELVTMVTTATSIEDKLCTIATAFLTLQLAALSSDKDLMSQSQALYATLLSVAQRYGFFSSGQTDLADLLPDDTSLEKRWQAWSRSESVKRLIACMISADWWWGNNTCTSPVVRPESLDLGLPGDDDLFEASNANEWMRLMQTGKNVELPSVKPRTFHLKGCLDPILILPQPLQAFSMFSMLNTIKHMVSDIHHRFYALVDDWNGLDRQVPWRTYQHDFRGRALVPIIVSLAQSSTSSRRHHDINVIVLWHNININLAANIQIFELAAGRSGALRGTNALADIAEWTKSRSARRAAVHAAHTYKLLSNRKVSDTLMLNSMSALFASALILSLYIFQLPQDTTPGGDNSNMPRFDVMSDVDWMMLGDTGLTDNVPNQNHSGVYDGSHRSAAADFINYGGPISINGTPASGYVSARRVLLEFAHLMDEMGAWKPKTFSRILHIMSDVLEEAP
ncbi:hypothetical protein MBLNU457_g0658t1 [Dothideomycetes sp. NU457]